MNQDWSSQEVFIYKNQLKDNAALGRHFIRVSLQDMEIFDFDMTQTIRSRPLTFMPILEKAVEVTQL